MIGILCLCVMIALFHFWFNVTYSISFQDSVRSCAVNPSAKDILLTGELYVILLKDFIKLNVY